MKPACADLRRARPLLGTFVEIAVACADSAAGEAAIAAAFAAVEQVHRLMSFHARDSDVARLNRTAAARPVTVHPWTLRVLGTALELHRRSGGLFDIATAPTLQDLGLLPRDRAARALAPRPSRSEPVTLLPGGQVRFRDPGVAIDLGGIAKGFAVDRAIARLRDHGMTQGLVNAGGDLAAFGPQAMSVALRDPRDPRYRLGHIALANGALASSGAEIDLAEASVPRPPRIIDPRVQAPVSAMLGATVGAPSCMIADALTKLVMIAGEGAAPLLRQYRARALFLSAEGALAMTRGWADDVQLAA